MKATKEDLARFNAFVNKKKDGCWEWTGRIDKYGYGEFKQGGVKHKAHRWVYQYYKGDLNNQQKHIDHLCRNRKCVRRSHLEAVMSPENTRRGAKARALGKLFLDID